MTSRPETQGKIPCTLELESALGFNGSIPAGLIVHPDNQHLIYPLGCTLVIENIATGKQQFLSGHTSLVSCLTVSKSGRYIASGQEGYMGFKADIILWDYEKRTLIKRMAIHQVKVERVAFSPTDKYLVSLGGQDDGTVVVWEIPSGEPICGSQAQPPSAGVTHCITFSSTKDELFFSAGSNCLRVWELDRANRKIWPTDVRTGQIKRVVKCLEVDAEDGFLYCGTTSGDIMKININSKNMASIFPEKERISLGVACLKRLSSGDLVLGTGEGAIVVMKDGGKKPLKRLEVEGAVTSISLRGQGHHFFVGTDQSQMYRFNYAEFKHELIKTCHPTAVNDIAFPFGLSELFATCGHQEIRVWKADTGTELLRIKVPNFTCVAIEFMRDGKSIISAWNDGKIRAFYPESGKLIFAISDAHNRGVTAIATTSDCKRIISGGGEGQIRVWDVNKETQTLVKNMKEHKGAVCCIRVKKNDLECVSASADGTCIIWDLQRFVRSQIIFAESLFRAITYHPEEFQILTSGTDRKVAWWETFDGALIREIYASDTGSINGVDIESTGQFFVTAGQDKLLKLWKYTAGDVVAVGQGHSAEINRVRFCPRGRHIVSVSADGGVIRWKVGDLQ